MKDGKFKLEKYKNLLSNKDLRKLNLNDLNHENGKFVIPNVFNGYDISYIAVKYLLDNLSDEKFNILIRNNLKVKALGKNLWNIAVLQFTRD